MSNDLKVKISTILERQIGQAEALGKEYGALEAQLAKVREMNAKSADTITKQTNAQTGSTAGGLAK